jgi:hypothetical protein
MSESTGHEITELLRAWRGGDEQALEKLTPRVYSELHQADCIGDFRVLIRMFYRRPFRAPCGFEDRLGAISKMTPRNRERVHFAGRSKHTRWRM